MTVGSAIDTSNMSTSHVSIVDSVVARMRLLTLDATKDFLSSVSLMESDPTYIAAKRTLLHLAPMTSVVPYVIDKFVDILDDINKRENFAFVKKRSSSSHFQSYLVLSLLSDFTEFNWRLKERSELASLSSRSTEDSDKDIIHRVAPEPLEPNLVVKAMKILGKIKSFKRSRSLIRELDGGAIDFELRYSVQVIADLDSDIDAVSRYLGAACPSGYSKFLESILSDMNDSSSSEMFGYLEFLSFLNLSPETFEKEFHFLFHSADSAKNFYVQHICSSFFIDAVLNFVTCYPKDLLSLLSKPSINKLGDTYFEKVYQKFKLSSDSEKRFYHKELAISLILMPKQFELFGADSAVVLANKSKILKTSNNRKQKLFHHVVKNLYEGVDKISTLEFFLIIFNAASMIIQYDPQHSIVLAAKAHVLQVYNILSPANNKTLSNDTELAAIDKIRVEFYSLAMILAPDLIKPKVINIIANPDTALQFYYIITHAILNLIKKPFHKDVAFKLIETIAITLRDHCGKLAKIVSETVTEYDSMISDHDSSTQSVKRLASTVSDSRTNLSSKYSSTTLSGGEVNGETSTFIATTNSHTSGNENSFSSANNTHATERTFTKSMKSRKDALFSAFTREKRGNSTSASSTVSHKVSISSQGSGALSSKDLASSANYGLTQATYNSDRSSIHSLSSSYNSSKVKSVSTANAEYLKKVENSAYLSREILKLILQIFRSYSGFFFKLPSIYSTNVNIAGAETPQAASSQISAVNAEAVRETKTILLELKRILDPILIALADNDLKLVEKARRLAMKILDAEDGSLLEIYVAFFSSCYLQSGFIDIILTYSLYNKKFLELMSFVTLFWSKRGVLLKKLDLDSLFENIGPTGIEMWQKCVCDSEKLLLITLSTPGVDFYRLLKLNCMLFSEELSIDCYYVSQSRKDVNFNFFKSIGDENYYVSSQVALQKRIRKGLYQHLDSYSEGLLAAIEITYERWKEYYLKRNLSNMAELEHRNYAGFLAVVFGGIMNPKYALIKTDLRVEELEMFIAKQIVHLSSEDIHEREAAKDLFANELHPHAQKLLMNRIQKEMSILIKKRENYQSLVTAASTQNQNQDAKMESEYLTNKDLTLLDLYVSILSGFLNYGEEDVIFALSADLKLFSLRLVTLLKPIISYDDSADSIVLENVYILRLKVKACKFFEKLASGSENLLIRGCSIKWRNELISEVFRWLDFVCFGSATDFDIFTLNEGTRANSRREMDVFIYFDLALECLKAISALFKETLIYAAGVQYTKEILRYRTTMFKNYFNLFSRILEQCLSRSDQKKLTKPGLNQTTKTSEPFANKTVTPAMSAIGRKIELIKDEVIVAISNMLEYNYDVGISSTMPLAFHSDLKVKNSFMIVFSNIIETMQKLKTKSTAEFETTSFIEFADRITANTDIIIAINRGILSTDYDDFACSLLTALMSTNREIPKIVDLIEFELESSSPNKIIDTLRRSSVHAKMLSLYAKIVGTDYLKSILEPVYVELGRKKDYFEIEKIQNTANDLIVEENLHRFLYYLKAIISKICSSTESIPIEFKVLCANIRRVVLKKSGNEATALLVLSSFLFLRFICPAIVNPTTEGIINVELSQQEKRSCIQLAKVFQVIANDSISTLRWSVLNDNKDELTSMKDQLFDFLDKISSENYLSNDLIERNQTIITKSTLSTLYSLLIHRNNEIAINLTHPIHKPKSTIYKLMEDMKVLERISIDIGERYLTFKPAASELLRLNRDRMPNIYDLFMKHIDSDISIMIDNPFLQQSYTRDGVLLFTLNHQFFQELNGVDDELKLFRAIQICYPLLSTEPFQLFIDCSFFHNSGGLVLMGFLKSLYGFAEKLYRNALRITYYNLNPGFYDYFVKRIKPTLLADGSRTPPIVFYSPFDPIETLEAAGTPEWSLNMVKDVQATYGCLIYSEDHKNYVPAVIKIGTMWVFWSYVVQKVEVNGQTTNLRVTNTSKVTDWYDAKDIDFINHDKNEFQITIKDHGVVHLSSSRKADLLKSLFLAKLTLQESNLATHKFFTNAGAPFSVDSFLGSMLASVLLNMVSSSDEVRNISFNSLVLLVNFYHLQIGKSIISEGANFPKDHLPYVLHATKALANNHPELTYDFITSIVEGYKSSENKYCCLMLISFWIKNIYPQYGGDSNSPNKSKIADLLGKCIKNIPMADDDLLLTYKTFLWREIVSDSNLVELAITGIIREALSKKVSGEDWENIVSVLSHYPTIEVCGLVVNKLVKIVDIPDFKTDKQISVEIAWIRVRILLKVMESLSFDSLMVSETYFAEICFAVSMLVCIGPYDLRVSTRNLIINVLHSFLRKDGLSDEMRNHILKNIDDFAGASSKITFGLLKSTTSDYSVMTDRSDQYLGDYFHLETFCKSLLKFIDLQTPELAKIWRTIWRDYVVKAAFHTYGPLQARAVLVSGILYENDLTDEIMLNFLDGFVKWGDDTSEDISDFITSIAFLLAFADFAGAIKKSSRLWGFFYWSVFIHVNVDSIIVVQGALLMLKNLLVSVKKHNIANEDVDFNEFFIKAGKKYDLFILRSEKRFKTSLRTGFADQTLVYSCIRGLQTQNIKKLGFDVLVSLFEVRIQHDLHPKNREAQTVRNPNIQNGVSHEASSSENIPPVKALAYLALIFMSSVYGESYEDIMKQNGLDSTDLIMSGDIGVPRLLIDFFATESDEAIISMYQLSSYFNHPSTDSVTRLRFLVLLNVLNERSPDLVIYAYTVISHTVANEIEVTGSLDILHNAFKFVEAVSSQEKFDHADELVAKYESIFVENGLSGIKLTSLTKEDSFSQQVVSKIVRSPMKKVLTVYYTQVKTMYDID